MAADHERVGPFDTDYPGTLVVASRCCSVDRLDAPSQRSNEIAGALPASGRLTKHQRRGEDVIEASRFQRKHRRVARKCAHCALYLSVGHSAYLAELLSHDEIGA
jgi:hypothetical protein